MLTRRDVNVKQVELLIADGFLPVSCDYRLCPELNILDGPMNDVCDALCWARFQLPSLAPGIALGLQADGDKVVAVGWATGGHLAMTLGFTAPKKGLSAPEAILAFHCPTDYEDDCKRSLPLPPSRMLRNETGWKTPRFPEGYLSFPHETGDVLRGIQSKPVSIAPLSILLEMLTGVFFNCLAATLSDNSISILDRRPQSTRGQALVASGSARPIRATHGSVWANRSLPTQWSHLLLCLYCPAIPIRHCLHFTLRSDPYGVLPYPNIFDTWKC